MLEGWNRKKRGRFKALLSAPSDLSDFPAQVPPPYPIVLIRKNPYFAGICKKIAKVFQFKSECSRAGSRIISPVVTTLRTWPLEPLQNFFRKCRSAFRRIHQLPQWNWNLKKKFWRFSAVFLSLKKPAMWWWFPLTFNANSNFSADFFVCLFFSVKFHLCHLQQ